MMNLELKALAKAGMSMIQIDEPYYSGFPEDVSWGVKALNTLVEGVETKIGLHVCYGNRYGKPSWEGSYRYLFPAILDAHIQQLTLEFARRGGEDLDLFREFKPPFELGVGVIDVKNHEVETPDMVAEHIRRALEVMPAERIAVLPDCGCFHLPRDVAFAKLKAMVEGAKDGPQGIGKDKISAIVAAVNAGESPNAKSRRQLSPNPSGKLTSGRFSTSWNWWPAPRAGGEDIPGRHPICRGSRSQWRRASPATRAVRPDTIRSAIGDGVRAPRADSQRPHHLCQ